MGHILLFTLGWIAGDAIFWLITGDSILFGTVFGSRRR